MKITYQASSDVALIKYWGKKDEKLRLPENGSISLILAGLDTVTTVDFDPKYLQDEVIIEGNQNDEESQRVIEHLDRIRLVAKKNLKAKVVSQNTFPRGTGLSSSGSGFAALTLAASKAIGLNLSPKELSILARQGSGTACRCVCSGFVEWKDGKTSTSSYSETLFSPDYWAISDVVAVVDEGIKSVSSTQGHQTASTSPFFKIRQEKIRDKIIKVKKLIATKDFSRLGEIIEAECLEFHSILLTSTPSLMAWYPGSVEVMMAVKQMRSEGIEAYFTINTGFNVHVLTLPQFEKQVQLRLNKLSLVKKTLRAKVGSGPIELSQHLF